MPTKSYSIVGMNHRGSEKFVRDLVAGAAVKLIREPNNKFDKNAIAVWVGDQHVGYIPTKQNKVLAAFIDQSGESVGAPGMAQDQAAVPQKSIDARFVRSPNSSYPMVEVID